MTCQTPGCSHPSALHVMPVGHCRINGCRCERFTDAGATQEVDPRQFAMLIPEGFMLRIEVVPIAAVSEEPAADEAAS